MVDIADIINRLTKAMNQVDEVDGSRTNHNRAAIAGALIEDVIKDLETLVDDGK